MISGDFLFFSTVPKYSQHMLFFVIRNKILNFIFKSNSRDCRFIPTTDSVVFGLGNPDTSISYNENTVL